MKKFWILNFEWEEGIEKNVAALCSTFLRAGEESESGGALSMRALAIGPPPTQPCPTSDPALDDWKFLVGYWILKSSGCAG
jgi:hypothetical protein